jgi:hypothetical protein
LTALHLSFIVCDRRYFGGRSETYFLPICALILLFYEIYLLSTKATNLGASRIYHANDSKTIFLESNRKSSNASGRTGKNGYFHEKKLRRVWNLVFDFWNLSPNNF